MSEYSNKSLKHWIVLICCCGLAASAIGSVVNTVGIFYTPVSENLGVLRGTFALHATFITLSIAFVSLIVPKLLDKLNFKLLIIIGSCMVAGSSILMAMSNTMVMFYIAAIIKGVGAGLYNILLVTTILNKWFKEKIGLATSITLSFSGVAGAVLSPILSSMIESSGWRMTYVVLGIIGFVLCLPAILYPFHMNPKLDHLLPYGAKLEEKKEESKESVSQFKPAQFRYIIFFIGAILLTAITGMTSHLPGFATSIGISTTTGALLISGTMIGNIGSKLLVGVLSDLFGALKGAFVMMAFVAVSVLTFVFIHQESILLVSSVLFGSCYGLTAVSLSLLTKQYFGEENYVKAYSVLSFGTNFGAAFAMSLFGYVYDFLQSYYFDFVMIIIFLAVNFVILNAIQVTTRKSLNGDI